MNSQNLKKLEQKATNSLSKTQGKTVILGLSGGADSVFLLHFLKKSKAKKIITAHVNHNLRKDQSNKDQFFCSQISEGLIHENKSIQLTGSSLEEKGRKARYQFFQALADKHQADFIITAHHADDNLETIILNLARGASLKGLTGMETETNLTTKTTLFRPLLTITKKEILDYLKQKQIPYQEDQSNLDQKYTRNKIRHSVIPLLKEINPNLSKTLSKNTTQLKEIQRYLEQEAKQFTEKHFPNLDAKQFRQKPTALQTEILCHFHEKIIGNRINISNAQIGEVLEIINKNIGNKQKQMGKIVVYLKGNVISAKKTTSPAPLY